jgi:hypothetical protein
MSVLYQKNKLLKVSILLLAVILSTILLLLTRLEQTVQCPAFLHCPRSRLPFSTLPEQPPSSTLAALYVVIPHPRSAVPSPPHAVATQHPRRIITRMLSCVKMKPFLIVMISRCIYKYNHHWYKLLKIISNIVNSIQRVRKGKLESSIRISISISGKPYIHFLLLWADVILKLLRGILCRWKHTFHIVRNIQFRPIKQYS